MAGTLARATDDEPGTSVLSLLWRRDVRICLENLTDTEVASGNLRRQDAAFPRATSPLRFPDQQVRQRHILGQRHLRSVLSE